MGNDYRCYLKGLYFTRRKGVWQSSHNPSTLLAYQRVVMVLAVGIFSVSFGSRMISWVMTTSLSRSPYTAKARRN